LSKKISAFYHEPEKQYNDTHPSTNEIRRKQEADEEFMRKTQVIGNMQDSHTRHNQRKVEREMLQIKSSQEIFEEQSPETASTMIMMSTHG
jgi:hypothetical protein